MKSIIRKGVEKFSSSNRTTFSDYIIVEEPLELFANSSAEPFLVTMRTPGDDTNLITGLLFSLEIIQQRSDIGQIEKQSESQVRIIFTSDPAISQNRFTTNSSCGLCNGTSWDDISSHSYFPVFDKSLRVNSKSIFIATQSLMQQGDQFSFTGGNHKVNLFSVSDRQVVSAEDVGRHNAFDKVVGQCINEGTLPLRDSIAVLSGRCSYEMCLKAWQAGIPMIVSKGAPTSKAIELAEAAGITLIGFARSNSFNVYSHPYRIKNEE